MTEERQQTKTAHGARPMSAAVAREADRQWAILKRGAIDIIPEDDLIAKLRKSVETGVPLRVKLGLDPSAPDIHVGHTVVLQKLREFQDCGHTVQLVIGDFTGRIGDPTGKSETRKQLTEEQVQANAQSYREQVFKVLNPERTEVHFNSAWLSPLSFADVVRLAATLTVARMLERDEFKKRYADGVPISIHEFFYPLMQGYDSVALQSDVELGGTDQTFNVLMGRTLQKEYGIEQQVIMTMPLIEGLDGVQKMSKSLGNYIGVNEPAREIYGKAMSIPDSLMNKYFELASGLPNDAVATLQNELQAGILHPRDAKMQLAHALAARFQGTQAADLAQEEFIRVFQKRVLPEDIDEFMLPADPLTLVSLLVAAKLAPSNSEARRLIVGGGARVDGVQIANVEHLLTPVSGMVIQVGKRRFIRLAVQ